MQKNKANKWQTSLNQIKKAKLKWRQFSVDKGSVLDHMKSMSFSELQETYNNLPDYFWRDNGEFFIHTFSKLCLKLNHLPCGNQNKLILVIAKPKISQNSYFWNYGQHELILQKWWYHQKVEFLLVTFNSVFPCFYVL